MDSRHELEISSAFSSQVNTGVPVEIVEAEHQAVETVLSNESGRRNVSRADEALDIGVGNAPIDSSQLASGMRVDPTQLSRINNAQISGNIEGGIASQLSAAVGESQLLPTSQLSTASIAVDTAQISSSMGVGATRLQENIEHLQHVSQTAIEQLNRSLATHTLEISPEAITLPSPQGSLSENLAAHMVQVQPHSTQGATAGSREITIERARQVLETYDLDISEAINSSVDPNLTVSSSMGTNTGGMDSGSVLNDPESPSSPESNFDSSELLNTSVLQQDELTARLAQAGPIGVAAAAAVMSSRKRKRTHVFESNPALRKRHCSKLVRKLRDTIEELSARVGLQAVVLTYKPGKHDPKEEPAFKVFGAAPLNMAVRNQKDSIVGEMEAALNQQAPPPRSQEQALHDLPPLVFDGIPTPVHKMTQAQLRAFIPNMLKFSTGRGKPGWGKEDMKPTWWPPGVPWANVRSDSRPEDQKKALSWTDALRRIVISCYVHHGRIDLLPEFSAEHLQQTISAETAEQLQLQLERLQQHDVFQQSSTSGQSEEGVATLAEVAASQPQELIGSENHQVFTVDTGMGNCDTSGMPTLADASLAETAAKLQQVADETGQVQYATQSVTVTDRDAKALGQPVGSTTTVLLTAYPGGHSKGLSTSESGTQFLSDATPAQNIPNVQVVYSAAHIESIPDSIVSSISSNPAVQPSQNFASESTTSGNVATQAIGDSAEYLNPAGQDMMVGGGGGESDSNTEATASETDLASQLINQYAGADSSTPYQMNEANSTSADMPVTPAHIQNSHIDTTSDVRPA